MIHTRSMRRKAGCFVLPLLALAAGGGLLAAAACSSDSPGTSAAPPGPSSAPVDGSFGEGSAPEPVDAAVPPGNVCGDGRGLQASSTWPMPGDCPTRAGWSPQRGPAGGKILWTAPLPTSGASSPALVASGVEAWVGADDGNVYYLSNGHPLFAQPTGGPVESSAAIRADGAAIIAGGDGVLYALTPAPPGAGSDAGDADASYPRPRVVFALTLGPMASSPAVAADGTIYVATLDGKLVAVTSDGKGTRWAAPTHDANGSSPAIGQDGTIYVGSSDHHLYAVHPDGSQAWAADLGAEVHASPAVGGDGTIYLGTLDGVLHAVAPDGTPRFGYATGGAITETPAVYAGAVYVGSADKKLHAVSTVDGKGLWTYGTLGAVGTPLVAGDGTVYVGSADEHVYAITPKGSLLFAATVNGRVKGALALGTGPELVASTDKGVVAFGP
jgi:outer membrane protein assembly factor BamB